MRMKGLANRLSESFLNIGRRSCRSRHGFFEFLRRDDEHVLSDSGPEAKVEFENPRKGYDFRLTIAVPLL